MKRIPECYKCIVFLQCSEGESIQWIESSVRQGEDCKGAKDLDHG